MKKYWTHYISSYFFILLDRQYAVFILIPSFFLN